MKDLKVIFMGTPVYCVQILENLIKDSKKVMIMGLTKTQKDTKCS